MVVLSVKISNDGEGFLYETATRKPVNELVPYLVRVHNGRLRARALVDAIEGLAEHGVMRPPDSVCNEEVRPILGNGEFRKEGAASARRKAWLATMLLLNFRCLPTLPAASFMLQGTNARFLTPPFFQNSPKFDNLYGLKDCSVGDPTSDISGLRVRNPLDPGLASTLRKWTGKLSEYVDKSQVTKRIALTEEELDEHFSNVRGALLMAYPMGLPKWDTVKLLLDGGEGLKETSVAGGLLDPETTSLWGAGKEFRKNQLLGDRIGFNEKTKIIVRLQKCGAGPPAREPAINEEEKKAMMAHYFKRNEELKRLSEADDDDYLNSQWADTQAMKKSLHGLNQVRMRM